MLPPRILGLLVILLAVQGLCKPTKSTEDLDYEEDTPFDEEDEEDEEEDNNQGTEAPPQILSERLSVRVKAGSTVILPCQVIHTENYALTWMKDNKMLYFETQPQIEDSKRIVRLPNNSLAIYNAMVSDSSNDYKCSILRKTDSIKLTHRLLVDPERSHQQSTASPPPQHSHKGIIRVIPSRRIDVIQGETIKFGCETDTRPPPEIKWFIENKKVDGYDSDLVLDGNYITIKKVNRSHNGLYQCLAEDGSKTPAMEAINVIVHYKPEIEVKRNIVHTGESIESEMTCIVSAYPEAIITWYKDDREITHKKGSIVMHHGIMKGNKTKHVLKILHTSRQDFGRYECRAQNRIGQDKEIILLTGTPSQARILGVEVDNNGIILKWRLESYSPIREYKLEYRRRGDEEWNVVEPEVKDGKGNQFTVEHSIGDLQPGSYEAILTARNAFGWSTPSEPHVFTGDYPSEMAQKEGNSAAIQTSGILALILVVLSCAFSSL